MTDLSGKRKRTQKNRTENNFRPVVFTFDFSQTVRLHFASFDFQIVGHFKSS